MPQLVFLHFPEIREFVIIPSVESKAGGMELTIESAFSTGGLVGHTSYLLLVISMFMRQIGPLRVFVILSAFVAIIYDVVWLKDPIGVFWETLLVAVNIVQLAYDWLAGRRAIFSAEERRLWETRFPTLNAREARRLLSSGLWVDAPRGKRLATEGEIVTHLIYVDQGRADISYQGKAFTWCGPGNFIGEMSVLDKGPASADAVLTEESRIWMISGRAVRRLARDHIGISEGLRAGFSADWREKLANQRDFALTGAVDQQHVAYS
ncbi:MAG: Crp/Fnr family transcriptional regulator [Pikeienuella sp.]